MEQSMLKLLSYIMLCFKKEISKTLIDDLNKLIKTYRDILGDTNLFDKVAEM